MSEAKMPTRQEVKDLCDRVQEITEEVEQLADKFDYMCDHPNQQLARQWFLALQRLDEARQELFNADMQIDEIWCSYV
jgi:hypothetical protein